MNKFEQVSSDGHPGITSRGGGAGQGSPMSDVWGMGLVKV